MLRPLGLGLLLVCAVSLTSSAVVTENGLPILWQKADSQLADLPTVLTPNPWNYLHRMGLYRLLIDATDPFMGSMGTEDTDSPMWALPLQLGWELNSGRLVDPTGGTNCGLKTGDTMCISTQSWWACENYFVSVLPFLSAMQQGFMGEGVQAADDDDEDDDDDDDKNYHQIKMQVTAGVEDYCTTYINCAARYPAPMAKWDAFFKGLKAARSSNQSDLEKKDYILGLFWDAHKSSMYASAVCNTRQSHYSSAEASFANRWIHSAEYTAAAHFQSNIKNSVMFMKTLPSRVLKDGDKAPNIADLSQEENHALSMFSWMYNMNNLLGGTPVRMWRSAMCSLSTREKGRALMEQMILNPSFDTNSFFSIMATSC